MIQKKQKPANLGRFFQHLFCFSARSSPNNKINRNFSFFFLIFYFKNNSTGRKKENEEIKKKSTNKKILEQSSWII